MVIHAIDETEESFLLFAQSGRFRIANYAGDKLFAIDRRGALPFQKNRRDRGVRLQSKRTMVARGSVGRNQFAKPGA